MSDLFIILGQDLVLGNGGFATGAPGNRLVAFVQPATLPADFEKVPDGVVVGIGHSEVRVVPIHEIAQAAALFSLNSGIFKNSVFAFIDEVVYAVVFDIFFGLEA